MHRWVIASILAGSAWCGMATAAEPLPGVGKTKTILDFEDSSIWKSENDSPFEASLAHVTQGQKSLKVRYTNKPEWSNILTDKLPADWSGFRYLNISVFLEGDVPAQCGLWIRDKAMHKADTAFVLGPGDNTISVDLDELKVRSDFDRGSVRMLCLYKNCPEEITVYFDNLYVSERASSVPLAPPVRMPATELLSNGGFEELQPPDALGNPFRWWLARRWQGRSFLGRGTAAVFSGKGSAMLDGRGACKIGFYSPLIKVQYPTRLKLTAYVQTDGVQQGLYRAFGAIAVTDAGEHGLHDADIPLPAGTNAWRKAELVFDVPDKCPAIKVFIQHVGPGRVWVDDLSLQGTALDTPCGLTWTETGRALKVDPPLTTESPELRTMREAAEKSLAELKTVVAEAKVHSVETLYDEIPLVLASLAFQVRWDLPEHLTFRETYATYVRQRSEDSIRHLRDVMSGRAPDLKVPPHPDFTKLKLKGRYFCEGEEPRLLLSMQYHNSGELLKWFAPRTWEHGLSAVGANRYDVQSTPVWEAYQKDPDTRRVYDDSWCGHIVCDKYSAGGSSQRCVISLDSPTMREAIAKSIARYGQRQPVRPGNLYVNVGFEYSYVNYDRFSADLFRQWLGRKYATIGTLNAIWKTDFQNFAAVTLPPYAPGQEEPNPAKYYDFGDFNLWRFTDYMKWAKGEVNKAAPGLPMTTGGGEPFGASFWRQGLDEEGLIRDGVNDVFLSETGSRALGITSAMDLQRSLAVQPTLILDPEYHAWPNTCFLMFLHGCGLMDYWWWPPTEGDFDESSMRHSPRISLEEVGVAMHTALDLRRLGRVVAPFPDAPAEIALLYARASLIQRYPKAQGHKTPYTLEMEKTYEAAVRLDAPVGFVSSRRVREGIPAAVKLLAIPGCRFVEEDVVAKIKDWVRDGGTLLITPTSLVADQYNRRRDYLAGLGLELVGEEVPDLLAGEAKRGIDQTGELDFIQGPVAKTIVSQEPKRQIVVKDVDPWKRLPRRLDAAGVIQTLKPSTDWTVVATYAGGEEPAILLRSLGKGQVICLAAQLTVDSRREVLDCLMDQCRLNRPVRARLADGSYPPGVESRTVRHEGALLTYLANTTGEKVAVELKSPVPIAATWNFNAETRHMGATVTLAPYETRIMRVELQE